MCTQEQPLQPLKQLDRVAQQDSPIHRLDPRSKIITTLLFLLCVTSMEPYAVAALLPFAAFPLMLLARSGLSARWLLHNVRPALPFVLLLGILNPFLDQRTITLLPELSLSAGWLSLTSLLLRLLLTLSAVLLLTATTPLPALSMAAHHLGLPKALLARLLLTWHALFLLLKESERMYRAYTLRAFATGYPSWSMAARLITHLLLRAMDRAHRLHLAMYARGFTGTLPLTSALRFRPVDALFLLGWSSGFLLCRFGQPVPWLGAWLLGKTP
ncbi:MAG: energy-coupling factor transporter transmembrane protein EcfT [Magnetococcales bacterium]|nr:energy-coupling factor transporter transmembrane protein EcfT [Magnetococcales bacterium]MBF0116153.1 energy-coupling factor transporter transmembrane protein EcfT [Magnetococcales bacterium]